MEEGLYYSEEALINRVLFLSEYNDINIFVEDKFKEYEYENIFNRMFNYKVKINSIFAMSGKPGVEKAFKEYGESYKGKPSIYLVDGDFDIICGKKMILHQNYIYLKKYNIESYYIDEKAVLKFMAGKMKKRQKEIESEIKFNDWAEDTYKKLQELFLDYIISQEQFPDEKNVGLSEHSYLDENGYVKMEKIESYRSKLKSRLSNYVELYDYYLNKFMNMLNGDSSRLICGKYLIASLTKYLRIKTNKTFKEDDFRYYLVGEFNMDSLGDVKEQVDKILSIQS